MKHNEITVMDCRLVKGLKGMIWSVVVDEMDLVGVPEADVDSSRKLCLALAEDALFSITI